jgi:hypothetical protein
MPVPVKLILGLMTLWGVVYAFVALAGDYALVPGPDSGRAEVSALESVVIHVHALNALAILVILSAIALASRSMPVGYRVAWVFAFLFFYPLALPAFWWLHVWRSPRRQPDEPRERTEDR